MSKCSSESVDSVDYLSSHDVELGELSQDSPEEDKNSAMNKEVIPCKISMLERWTNTLLMVPVTFITNLFAALCTVNGNRYFAMSSGLYHLLVFSVMLNFYASILGIIIWHVFRIIARCCHLVAFLCALLSLTILFNAILPDELNCLPWILLAFVLLVVFVLLVNELSSLQHQWAHFW